MYATPAGKACGLCAAVKATCYLMGRTVRGSQSHVDHELLRRVLDKMVGSELWRLQGTIKRHTWILWELNREIFA